MNYRKETGTFKSSNGSSDIAYYIYKPLNPPKAILQISHGMCEYIERYEHFIDFLAEKDILVCGNDHLGHKNSVSSKDKLGYFAPRNGWVFLAKDLASMTKKIKRQYPDVPNFLLGHSMGSFIARVYLAHYGNLIQGAIICGTAGSNPAIGLAKLTTFLVKKVKGETYRSELVNKMMFGAYNSKYPVARTSHDWLCRDEAAIDQYLQDEYCTFLFTASAFGDLVTLLDAVSQDSWYDAVPKSLPIFLVSGSMDPVGNWGKGIAEVKKRLEKRNLEDFTSKFYEDYRHEILNEVGKEIVYQDIFNWLSQRI